VWAGVAGMLCVVAAWAIGLREVPPPRLSLLYAVGSVLLTVHSLTIGDAIFTGLNSAAAALALANLARWLRRKGKR